MCCLLSFEGRESGFFIPEVSAFTRLHAHLHTFSLNLNFSLSISLSQFLSLNFSLSISLSQFLSLNFSLNTLSLSLSLNLSSQGRADLEAVTKGFDRVIFVGVTCGLSAPYVAGQIEYALSQVPGSGLLRKPILLLFFHPLSQCFSFRFDMSTSPSRSPKR